MRLLGTVALALVLIASSTAQPSTTEPIVGDKEQGPEPAPGFGANPAPAGEWPRVSDSDQGEAAVTAEETVQPSMDSRDPAWKPGYAAYEDPSSVNCDGRKACQDYKSNQTRSG